MTADVITLWLAPSVKKITLRRDQLAPSAIHFHNPH